MEINRNNYETFFLLYVDDELETNDRLAVEAFAGEHADLQEELDLLMQTKLPLTDKISFENKTLLYKQADDAIVHSNNYGEYFLSYIDNELSGKDRAAVEMFMQDNPGKQAEMDLLQRVKIEADETVIFEHKESLYRTEKETVRLIPFPWMRIAAAASVILIGSVIWMNTGVDKATTEEVKTSLAVKQSVDSAPATKTVDQQIVAADLKTGDAALSAADNRDDIKNKSGQETSKQNNAVENDKNYVAAGETPQKQQVHKDALTTIDKHVAVSDRKSLTTENTSEINEKTKQAAAVVTASTVKPVILDAAAFNGDENEIAATTALKDNETAGYLDIDNTDKKSKGKFRGLFRKASRFIDRVTNADTEENQSVVRVASFEIAKK